ncbi:hypothetical protein Taro_021857, partial [Colocasia esculenta]|nr:hypothetical protein [Colocasia esculenta]
NEVEEVDPEQPEIQLGDSDEEEYISDQNESDNEDVNAKFDISPTSEDEMENLKIWFEDGVGLLQWEEIYFLFYTSTTDLCTATTGSRTYDLCTGTTDLCIATTGSRLKASSDDPLLLGGSLDLGEGFPNTGLKLASTENQEKGSFGDFLGLPKESFINLFDPFEDLFRGKYLIHFVHILNRVLDPPFHPIFGARSVLLHRQELGVNALAAKISSLRPAILPSNPLNGQRLPLSLVGDFTPLEETVESDSERGE